MREIQVCLPEGRGKGGAVHRLQFSANARELAAWVEPPPYGGYGRRAGVTAALSAYDLAADTSRPLIPDDWLTYYDETSAEPFVSPDLTLIAVTYDIDSGEGTTDGIITFTDPRDPDLGFPSLTIPPAGAEVLFTPDGSALV